jgi:hypothetical protein
MLRTSTREAIAMTEKEDVGRLGFLDPLARLFRPKGETTAPPQPEPQWGGFAKLETDFETALRGLREKVAEQLATAGPGAAEHRKTAEEIAAERQHRIDDCHRAIREDIGKMHVRLGTGLSPADLDSIDALLVERDRDLVLTRTEAAIGKELAALQTAVAGGSVHSIEQANAVVASSLRALDEVVPELVWQYVRSLLPQAACGEFAS